MPARRNKYAAHANRKRNATRTRRTNSRTTGPRPSVSQGYINRRSAAWRKATGDAINRNR